jgi:hypothetical protein
MDILKVLSILSREFEKHELHYAVIGGFALNALGLSRSTIDLDFLVLAEDTTKLQKILELLSYSCVYKSQNVSQYTSPSREMGEIDVLHAFRAASLKMLKRARKLSLFNNTIDLYVLCPEDITGLKLQAMMNDESRKERELADIQLLMEHFNTTLDWEIIKEHFDIFEQNNLYETLKGRYGKI